ncbi:MAG: aspartate aminotransferase family protein [Bacteroidetes bacterium]|nr:aspartate aminotransferase family protein [Bacteroidota bacterium]
MKYWKKLSHDEQDIIITKALNENIDYKQNISLGIPASLLDPFVFYDQATFLKDAPLLRTYIQNPNHIGCHTLGDSEVFFKGTQKLEQETIELICVDIFKAAPDTCDGYIASGGTEANIQAIWMYRNFFMQEYLAQPSEIAILSSQHTHYSITKAANLLNLKSYSITVDSEIMQIIASKLYEAINTAKSNGIKYFIAISNMGTTMFGSIDDPAVYISALKKHNVQFKLHIDGAFGGFIYPISDAENRINFSNPYISSITLDAHKMLQAPYGTGIFLARKNQIEYVYTKEASYVNGMDLTLCGSRSGANAIAVWMILHTYGPYGWLEKINKLIYRTDWCCSELDKLQVTYYRHPKMNIITIPASHISSSLAHKYGLVPDTHNTEPSWYKIVIMDHVELQHLNSFINELTKEIHATTLQ